MARAYFLLSVLIFVLTACSINPTPVGISKGETDYKSLGRKSTGQFVKDYTAHIVEHVKCEARDAMVRAAAGLIDEANKRIGYEDPNQIAKTLFEKPWESSNFKPWQIDPLAYTQASLFLKATIGFAFDLTTKESNDRSVQPTFSASGGDHSVSLGITNHTMNSAWQNQRKFSENTSQFQKYQSKRCYYDKNVALMKDANVQNFFYPMKGNIDLAKSINAFIGLSLTDISANDRYSMAEAALLSAIQEGTGGRFTNIKEFRTVGRELSNCQGINEQQCELVRSCYEETLILAGDKYMTRYAKKRGSSSFAMTDKLTFTTTVSGGLNPSIQFSPASGSFKLQKAMFGLTGSRMDTNILDLVLTTGAAEAKKKKVREIKIGGDGSFDLVAKVQTGNLTPNPIIRACVDTTQSVGESAQKASRKRQLFPDIPETIEEIEAKNTEFRRILNDGRLDSIQDSLDRISEPLPQ